MSKLLARQNWSKNASELPVPVPATLGFQQDRCSRNGMVPKLLFAASTVAMLSWSVFFTTIMISLL